MKITSIQATVERDTLKVIATVEEREGIRTEAYLPSRETAALLPREILAQGGEHTGRPLIPLMNELLEKLTLGREVRVWEYNERLYCSFPRWRKADLPSPEDAAREGMDHTG